MNIPLPSRFLIHLLALGTFASQAAETEKIRVQIGQGQTAVVELDFVPSRFESSNEKVARVASALTGRTVNIIGEDSGQADVLFTGPDQASQIVGVTVIDQSLEAIQKVVRKNFPMLESTIVANRVNVTGEIDDIETWKRWLRAYGDYEAKISNTVIFLADSLVENVVKMLGQAGFTAMPATGTQAPQPGQVLVGAASGVMTVSGLVYAEEDLVRLERTLSATGYLVPEDKHRGLRDDRIPFLLNISVFQVRLEVDIALVAVTDASLRKIGDNLWKEGIVVEGDLSFFRAKADTHTIENHSIGARTSLNGALKALEDVGDGLVVKRAGANILAGSKETVVVEENKILTILAKPGVFGGGDASSFDFKGGMQFTLKNCRMKDPLTAVTSLDFTANEAVRTKEDEVVQTQHKNTFDIQCPVGQSTILSAFTRTVSSTTESGVPVLRKIPLLGRLFSSKTTANESIRTLIIVGVTRSATDSPAASQLLPETRAALSGKVEEGPKPVEAGAAKP